MSSDSPVWHAFPAAAALSLALQAATWAVALDALPAMVGQTLESVRRVR